MSTDDPDFRPVQPYPGYPGTTAASEPAAEPVPARRRPAIEPAEPREWTKVLPLKHALVVDGLLLDSLTIRRLTGRDIADLLIEDDEETSLNSRARALAAGIHPDVIEALAADDAEAFADACRPFLPAALVAIEEQMRADLLGEI